MVKFSRLNISFLALGFLAAVKHLLLAPHPSCLRKVVFDKESQLQLCAWGERQLHVAPSAFSPFSFSPPQNTLNWSLWFCLWLNIPLGQWLWGKVLFPQVGKSRRVQTANDVCKIHIFLNLQISANMSESRTEYKLKSPPEDGITNVTFGPNSSQVSWDKKKNKKKLCFSISSLSRWYNYPLDLIAITV